MICDICGKQGARVRRTTRSFGSGRSQSFIEVVPLVRCPHCGEAYLTSATLNEIEHVRKRWRKLAVAKQVRVAKFEQAA